MRISRILALSALLAVGLIHAALAEAQVASVTTTIAGLPDNPSVKVGDLSGSREFGLLPAGWTARQMTFQVDLAWDPAKVDMSPAAIKYVIAQCVKDWGRGVLLPYTVGSSAAKIHWGVKVQYEGLPAPTIPVGATTTLAVQGQAMPAATTQMTTTTSSSMPAPAATPVVGPGWKAGRFVVTIEAMYIPGKRISANGRMADPEQLVAESEKGVVLICVKELNSRWMRQYQTDEGREVSAPIEAEIASVRGWQPANSRAVKQLRDKLPSETLDQDLYGKRARLDAIKKQIALLRDSGQTQVKEDPIVKELEHIVQLREEQFKQTQAAVGQKVATDSDVREAELKVLEAKVQLAQRREAVVNASVGELLPRLNNEQAMISVDIAEIDAKKHYIQDQIDKLNASAEQLHARQTELENKLRASQPWLVTGATVLDPTSRP